MVENRAKISVCVMVRDEQEYFDRFFPKLKDFDEVVVLWTGIKKETYRKLKSYSFVKVVKYKEKSCYNDTIDDYAKARNTVQSYASNDIIAWFDIDDVIENVEGLFNLVSYWMVQQSYAGLILPYNYAYDDYGNCITKLPRVRVYYKNKFKWVYPIHESIAPVGSNIELKKLKNWVVYHFPTKVHRRKSLKRNIKLLEKHLGNMDDPRMLFYLAKSYFGAGQHEKGLRVINGYLKVARWTNEKYDALVYAADACMKLQQPAKAYKYLMLAVSIAPQIPTAFILIGRWYMFKQEWQTALNHFSKSESLKFDDTLISYSPTVQSIDMHVFKAECYEKLNDFENAVKEVEIAYERKPMNDLYNLLIYLRENLKKQQLLKDFVALVSYAVETGQLQRAQKLIDNAPGDLKHQLVVQQFKYSVVQKLKEAKDIIMEENGAVKTVTVDKVSTGKKDKEETVKESWTADDLLDYCEKIDYPKVEQASKFKVTGKQTKRKTVMIWCGQGSERFSPYSLSAGCGGSEEAVIYLSRALTEVGYKVTVYAPCENEEGVFGNVTWRDYSKIDWTKYYDYIVFWRITHPVLQGVKVNASKCFLWLHDVPVSKSLYPDVRCFDNFDKVIVLSDYHRHTLIKRFPKIDKKKIFLSRNGIHYEPVDFTKRNPKQMFFSSSIDRGLDHLVYEIFPRVKDAVPDAKLKLFYGTKIFDRMCQTSPDGAKRQLWKQQLLAEAERLGIENVGRVSQAQLKQEIAQCGVWPYPTEWPEISCITAILAQAYGAVPVCTIRESALDETVKYGIKVHGDIRDAAITKQYANLLIDVLKNTEKQEEIRQPMIQWARKTYPWFGVASQWDKDLFKGGILL